MFGHSLRLHPETPAQKAMDYFFTDENLKKFRGKQRTTLPTVLNNDMKEASKTQVKVLELSKFEKASTTRTIK